MSQDAEFLKQNNINKYNKQNPWVSLLRIFMCFVVIRDHFPPTGDTIIQKIVGEFGSIAVPCFMFLSFFFMGKDIRSLNIERLKVRLIRLYMPIVVWNFFYWGCKNIIYSVFSKSEYIISVNGLLEGLLFSHYPDLTPHLWFLFSQIVILLITCILLSYSKSDKKKAFILFMMMIIAFLLEYSGVNIDMFGSSVYAIKYPLGRCIECIPYAVVGTLFSWFYNDNIIKKTIVMSISLFLTICARYFISNPAGFGYGGFYLLFASTAICIFAFILPNIFRDKLLFVLNYIGACTMGVYCLHMLVGWMLQIAASKISVVDYVLHINTLIFDAIIFVICFVITVSIRLVNKKINWKWLEYIV